MKKNILTYKEAKQSPCLACNSVLCCSLLTLTEFTLLTLSDLDLISYYLNFRDIVVILDRSGECHIYYSKACRFFNNQSKTCSIHNQPSQSATCVYYNPYRCFYKNLNDDKKLIQYGSIWLDHERLEYLSEQIGFDESRNIVQMPNYEKLVEKFNSSIPYNRNSEPAFREKEEPVFIKNTDICYKCSGICCRKLLIQKSKPSNTNSLDFYNYSMNFPGIEYLISDNRWAILVDTKCKYLDEDNKCSIINMDERPLNCRYMNPLRCRINDEINRSDQIKADFSNFDKIEKGIKTNEKGEVIFIEPIENLKKFLSE